MRVSSRSFTALILTLDCAFVWPSNLDEDVTLFHVERHELDWSISDFPPTRIIGAPYVRVAEPRMPFGSNRDESGTDAPSACINATDMANVALMLHTELVASRVINDSIYFGKERCTTNSSIPAVACGRQCNTPEPVGKLECNVKQPSKEISNRCNCVLLLP